MDNKYELMDELNYSRSGSLSPTTEENRSIPINTESIPPKTINNHVTSLDTRLLHSLPTHPYVSHRHSHVHNKKAAPPYNIPIGISDTENKTPLVIPKSTRLKAERVRIYLDYFYNVLERCISLDQDTSRKSTSSLTASTHTHSHRHHHHEGVEGVYNPLQVIRNRKLRKKYHAELKPLRELTFTKVPLIAVVQFSSKPNRKMKWFVELSEKYSDLTWRTSHWNELRKPDGERWIMDPKYNMLLNVDGDRYLSQDDYYSHRKRDKLKKKIKQIKNGNDPEVILAKKQKKKKKKDGKISPLNHHIRTSSSTISVNIIDPLNLPSSHGLSKIPVVPELASGLNKFEKILSKTKAKGKFSRSPNKSFQLEDDNDNDDINIPEITTTIPTPINESFPHHKINNTNNNIQSHSLKHLSLPGNNKSKRKSHHSRSHSSESNDKTSISNPPDKISSIASSNTSTSKFTVSTNSSKNQTPSISKSQNPTLSSSSFVSSIESSHSSGYSSSISGSSSMASTSTSSSIYSSSSSISPSLSNEPLSSLSKSESDSESKSSSSSSIVLNIESNKGRSKNTDRRRGRRKSMIPDPKVTNDTTNPTEPITNPQTEFVEDRDDNLLIDEQLDTSYNRMNVNDINDDNLLIDEQLLQYWQDTRYILSTISIMKHRRKTHDIVKKRAIQRRNDTIKIDDDTDFHIVKTKEIIDKYDKELDKVIKIGNKWTSKLLNDYSIRVETLISSSDRILSDINTTLTLKLKLFQENTERFDNFKMVHSQRSTRLVYKLLEIMIIGILWTIWLFVIITKKIKMGVIIILKVIKWMVW